MVNLVRFRERSLDGNGSGWDAYSRYSKADIPLLKKVGGTTLGRACRGRGARRSWGGTLGLGGARALPLSRGLPAMMTSPEYALANVDRENGVEDHVILAANQTHSKFSHDQRDGPSTSLAHARRERGDSDRTGARIVQIRQSTQLARTTYQSEGNVVANQIWANLMGDRVGDVIESRSRANELTYSDFMALDAFLFTSINMLYRDYQLAQEGLFSEPTGSSRSIPTCTGISRTRSDERGGTKRRRVSFPSSSPPILESN